jgi:hypothetical protein
MDTFACATKQSFQPDKLLTSHFSIMPSAIMSPTTATATPVEIMPGTITHIIPLITPIFTTVIESFLPLLLPFMPAISYAISPSVPVLLNTS